MSVGVTKFAEHFELEKNLCVLLFHYNSARKVTEWGLVVIRSWVRELSARLLRFDLAQKMVKSC